MTTLPLEAPSLASLEESVARKHAGPRQRSTSERQAIERAKAILMQQLQMSEPQAHRCLQRTSMDKALPITEIAQQVIRLLG